MTPNILKSQAEKRGLGRGLTALMGDVSPAETARPAERQVSVDRIHPNPEQPRRHFDEAALDELAASIRSKGVIQPLVLRPHPAIADAYQIVAGERRWRAAQRAEVHAVPAVIRDLDDTEVLEIAIIENVQRADLNPVEEALGFRQLIDRFGHTQERLAQSIGKSRSHIANVLRLLSLPEEVLDLVRTGKLTAGHARALVTTADPVRLAREVLAKGLSVRETERLAAAPRTARKGGAAEKDADTRALERDLGAALGMGVSITHDPGGEGGALIIRYRSLDGLDELCRRLGGAA